MPILLISAFIIIFIVGFYIGKIQERKDWNKLIEKGIIRKPNKKNNYVKIQ